MPKKASPKKKFKNAFVYLTHNNWLPSGIKGHRVHWSTKSGTWKTKVFRTIAPAKRFAAKKARSYGLTWYGYKNSTGYVKYPNV